MNLVTLPSLMSFNMTSKILVSNHLLTPVALSWRFRWHLLVVEVNLQRRYTQIINSCCHDHITACSTKLVVTHVDTTRLDSKSLLASIRGQYIDPSTMRILISYLYRIKILTFTDVVFCQTALFTLQGQRRHNNFASVNGH